VLFGLAASVSSREGIIHVFIPLFAPFRTLCEIYVEVTLKPLDAPDNQTGVNNIIIVLVPRSQIDITERSIKCGKP
jgi:hypothetical protein